MFRPISKFCDRSTSVRIHVVATYRTEMMFYVTHSHLINVLRIPNLQQKKQPKTSDEWRHQVEMDQLKADLKIRAEKSAQQLAAFTQELDQKRAEYVKIMNRVINYMEKK